MFPEQANSKYAALPYGFQWLLKQMVSQSAASLYYSSNAVLHFQDPFASSETREREQNAENRFGQESIFKIISSFPFLLYVLPKSS